MSRSLCHFCANDRKTIDVGQLSGFGNNVPHTFLTPALTRTI
jgi:hypothetical protein